MSLRLAALYPDRDFNEEPLQREETQIHFDPVLDKSLTQQHHNEGRRLDTTAIMSKFFKDGVISHTREGATARYIDAVHFQDFAQAMNTKVRADEAFNSLDENLRHELFNNSQEEFVKFCLDEKNLDKLRELGLANPIKGPAAPIEVIVKNPAPEAPTETT